MKYFAYGSNMSLKRLQHRVPGAVPIGTFSLPEHHLVFHKHGRDDSAKCDAYHTHNPSNIVIGRLYEIDELQKPALDHAERLGNGYEEKIIRVFNTKDSFKAITYYATYINNTLKPFTWYKQHVLTGAQEANLPKAYIDILESIIAIEDWDKAREAQELSIHYKKEMIDSYSFGIITVSGKRYSTDIKIINGKVYPDWWRKSGHSVDIKDVSDILDAKPEYLVIGSGKFGLMKMSVGLRRHLEECGIQVVVEPTPEAVERFNQMYADSKNVAAGFHLTC